MGIDGLNLGHDEDSDYMPGGSSGDEDEIGNGEDDLCYSRTFDRDAELHGASYAKYKQKMLKELFERRDDIEEEKDGDSSKSGDETDIDEVDDY